MANPKVIVILGPTATGKSDLAVHLAQKFNGEIISADSRQVYRGLDIGTGKITKKEMCGVPHHLLDVADPKEQFSVADFVRIGEETLRYLYADKAGIERNGKVPIIAGGTGFYISALLGEITLPNVVPNEELREELETLSIEELVKRLEKLDPNVVCAVDTKNKRRLVRYIEVIETLGELPKTQSESKYETLKIGLDVSDEELRERIKERLLRRIEGGMIKEAISLHKEGLSYTRMDELGLEYRYLAKFLQNKIPIEELIEQLSTKIWQYAKRQRTWFKKDKEIEWFHPSNQKDIEQKVSHFLA